jgi:arylsulfatase A-like enzyme
VRAILLTAVLFGCPRPPPPPAAPAAAPALRAAPTPPAVRWAVGDPSFPPNVLVLVIDDMGVDKQAIYQVHPQPSPTPVLDALASRSAVFRTAWATPGCTPTRAAALTGRYATHTTAGIPATMPGPAWQLPLSEVTIPEMLATAAIHWSSAAIGKWHLATYRSVDPAHHPVAQGFDWYAGSLANLNTDFPGTEKEDMVKRGYADWVKVDVSGAVVHEDRYATRVTADDAITLLSGLSPPWFGWVAWNAVHVPLDPPPADLWTGPIGAPGSPDRYDAVAGAMDAEIGILLAAIPPEVLATTVLVVFGDNGTPGHAIRPPLDTERGKMTLYPGGVRVPLYVSGPGIPAGFREQRVHVVDLLPTVAALAGADVSSLALDGQSFLPALGDPAAPGRDVLYTEYLAPNGPPPWRFVNRAARDDRFHLIAMQDGTEHLLDMTAGPDGGPDLLASGALPPEAATSLSKLRAEIALHRSMTATP